MHAYIIESIFHTHDSVFNDMKAFFKKFGNSRKPMRLPLSITSDLILTPGPESTTSTSTADPIPFVPTGLATMSAQVIQATGVTVSVQFGPLY